MTITKKINTKFIIIKEIISNLPEDSELYTFITSRVVF